VKKAIQLYEELSQKEPYVIDYGAIKWLLECIVASEKERKNLISDELAEDFYKYWTNNNYANLKDYLRREFKVNNFTPDNIEKYFERRAYLKDLLMYNNPRRNDWEKSDEIIKHLNLKKGDRVIDIGCGFGFYSYRFSRLVGTTGKVWAIDINETYINYMKEFVKKYKIANIVPVLSKVSDVSVSAPSDVAFMCSVYHVIYGWLGKTEREQFISSIKRSLKQGGMLVIADNSFDNGNELNSCYLNKELVIAQFAFYGFRFIKYVRVSPQRYLLMFKQESGETAPPPTDVLAQVIDSAPGKKGINNKTPYINITSGDSLIHLIHPQYHIITEKSREAAGLVYEALKNKNLNATKEAIRLYNDIIPVESFRGENSALQWLCEYLTSPQHVQAKMLKNSHVKAFYNYLAKENFNEMMEYMIFRYRIQHKLNQEKKEQNTTNKSQVNTKQTKDTMETSRMKHEFFDEFILFNNPKREEWEKTNRIIELLNLKEGETIGDILSRSGHYTYKFSQIVGEHGKVYAIDGNEGHINFIKNFIKEQKIKNIETVKLTQDNISLEKKVDYLFLSSFYPIIYGVLSESKRANFIMSIKKALKKDGRLIIVDNGPVETESMSYYGFYIDKELITSQLSYYGFTLEKYEQITPWQYMLTFKLN
jgi:ubiquinone/menaquinone biosynthesis C-methylase UbiE